MALERQQVFSRIGGGRAKQGIHSAFEKGFAYAMWRTALLAAGFVEWRDGEDRPGGSFFVCPLPSLWKAHMSCAGAEGDRKLALKLIVEVAQRIHPQVDLRAIETAKDPKRCRAPSADKGAALLLAEFARTLWRPT